MRIAPAAIVALCLVAAWAWVEVRPAAAQESQASVEQQIDEAFVTLQTSQNRQAAKIAERRIIALWLDSGSATIDLLMSWTLRAMDEEDYPLALDYLDRIITLKPDYAEGWNKRATVFFLVDEFAKSLADIEQVLALEPRHFGALSGLGMILSEIGEYQRAIGVFRQALAVDPLLDNVREALDKLLADNAGTNI